MKTSTDHYAEYCRDGFTIFRQYLPTQKVAALRRILEPILQARFAANADLPRAAMGDALSNESLTPYLSDHLLNPMLLDFAERVIGPYVQLDSYRIVGFSTRPRHLKNQVDLWHRDAFNLTETWATYNLSHNPRPRPYTPPMACNCLTYLQDMNAETGSLRVIPGSHLDYTFIPEADVKKPHPNEKLIRLSAGDMVFTHCELLHSGSLNSSGAIRYFVSIYLQRFGLPHRDNFATPTIAAILQTARKRNERRTMRLFGCDKTLHQRQQKAWQRMIEEDGQATLAEWA